jgi:hypothetical protein
MLSPFWNGVYIGFSNELSFSAKGFNNSMSRIDIASGFRGPGSSYTLDQVTKKSRKSVHSLYQSAKIPQVLMLFLTRPQF